MFRQIYELTVLGMHPTIPYPRRSQFRPLEVSRVLNCTAPLKGAPYVAAPLTGRPTRGDFYESWNASYSAICRHENKLHAMQSPFSCASALVDA